MELESLGPPLLYAPGFGREAANTKPLKPKITFNIVNIPTLSMRGRNKIHSSRFQVVDTTGMCSSCHLTRSNSNDLKFYPNLPLFQQSSLCSKIGIFPSWHSLLYPCVLVTTLHTWSSWTPPLLNAGFWIAFPSQNIKEKKKSSKCPWVWE